MRCSHLCTGRRAGWRGYTPGGLSVLGPEAGDPLTGGGWHSELGELLVEDLGDNGQDPCLGTWGVEVMSQSRAMASCSPYMSCRPVQTDNVVG